MEIHWRCIRASEVSSAEWRSWEVLQESNASLRSPYFHPMFTRLVADIREDVYVAIGTTGDECVAFFPFQKEPRSSAARPVGGWLNDFHGIVARDHTSVDISAMLQACGLSVWRFTHLVETQDSLLPFAYRSAQSPFIELAQGFDSYITNLRPECRENLRKFRRTWRRAEHFGTPWRFEFDSADEGALAQLVAWKSAQYRRSHLTDIFQFPWVGRLMASMHKQKGDSFRGVLSTLHLGNNLVAAHFGIYCRGLLHYWFPGFDLDHARSAPGNMLLLAHIERGSDLGVRRIELGKGMTQFKKALMSDTDLVYEGALSADTVSHQLRYRWWKAKQWIEQTPFFTPLRFIKHSWLGWDGSHGIR